MTGEQYVILAYALSILLLWGYAAALGVALRGTSRRGRAK
jgi:hypothetical protein